MEIRHAVLRVFAADQLALELYVLAPSSHPRRTLRVCAATRCSDATPYQTAGRRCGRFRTSRSQAKKLREANIVPGCALFGVFAEISDTRDSVHFDFSVSAPFSRGRHPGGRESALLQGKDSIFGKVTRARLGGGVRKKLAGSPPGAATAAEWCLRKRDGTENRLRDGIPRRVTFGIKAQLPVDE